MPGFICLLMKSVTWNLEAVLSTLGVEENYWGRGVAAHPWWCGEHHGNRFLFLVFFCLHSFSRWWKRERKWLSQVFQAVPSQTQYWVWLSVFTLTYSWGCWNWQSQIIWYFWLLTERQLHVISPTQPFSAELKQICSSHPSSLKGVSRAISCHSFIIPTTLSLCFSSPHHVEDKLEQLLVLQQSRVCTYL